MNVITFSPDAIAARQGAYRARKASIHVDLHNISENIENRTKEGCNSLTYQIKHKENMNFIIAILRDQGYKVRRSWLFHNAQNEIEVKW